MQRLTGGVRGGGERKLERDGGTSREPGTPCNLILSPHITRNVALVLQDCVSTTPTGIFFSLIWDAVGAVGVGSPHPVSVCLSVRLEEELVLI